MITVIGDVHGKFSKYLSLISNLEASVQVGDFGLTYDCLDNVYPTRHVLFAGNHDAPDLIYKCPNYLGSFGCRTVNYVRFFFVSGANSIDKQYRIPGLSWWPDEELSQQQMYEAFYKYWEEKPEIVLSHDCPTSVCIAMHGDNKYPSRTDKLLEQMFSVHKPKLWIFGHHHRSWTQEIHGTKFVCLNELETFSVKNFQ